MLVSLLRADSIRMNEFFACFYRAFEPRQFNLTHICCGLWKTRRTVTGQKLLTEQYIPGQQLKKSTILFPNFIAKPKYTNLITTYLYIRSRF